MYCAEIIFIDFESNTRASRVAENTTQPKRKERGGVGGAIGEENEQLTRFVFRNVSLWTRIWMEPCQHNNNRFSGKEIFDFC